MIQKTEGVNYVAKTLGISKAAKGIKKLKIVVDSGNGMGAKASAVIFDKLGLKPKMLFSEQDGSFPNHTPNPLNEENLIELKKTIKKEKADIGIAFDGDADRVGFVDENGLTVPNDLITALVAKELLKGKQGKKEKILFEIRSSWAVRDEIKRCGGIPLLWKAGHALIKEKMKEDDVLFGGEKSGHYFFRDFWYADCADIAALHVLKLMSDTGKKISELVAPLRIYFNPGEINFKLNDKDDAMEAVEKEFSSGKIMHLDGLTIEFNDWWFNLRKSNTEPYLRLNIEAKTEER
ncbi:MAG: phosphomannomutase/phosphoglucomutase, partial [Candidatus Woesearchaeota archaeon]|nr:phosphomannomutase/phosphoglucomutase [Candidatus Woesearchaeota archaeon]